MNVSSYLLYRLREEARQSANNSFPCSCTYYTVKPRWCKSNITKYVIHEFVIVVLTFRNITEYKVNNAHYNDMKETVVITCSKIESCEIMDAKILPRVQSMTCIRMQ